MPYRRIQGKEECSYNGQTNLACRGNLNGKKLDAEHIEKARKKNPTVDRREEKRFVSETIEKKVSRNPTKGGNEMFEKFQKVGAVAGNYGAKAIGMIGSAAKNASEKMDKAVDSQLRYVEAKEEAKKVYTEERYAFRDYFLTFKETVTEEGSVCSVSFEKDGEDFAVVNVGDAKALREAEKMVFTDIETYIQIAEREV